MKRIKAVNNWTIYLSCSKRDEDNYNCTIGNYNIYSSSDIKDYGLAYSDANWEDVDSLQEAIELCTGSNWATASLLAEEFSTSTCTGIDDVQAIEERLDNGESAAYIRDSYSEETGILYSSPSERELEEDAAEQEDMLIEAMQAAGYEYDELESYHGWRHFFGECGAIDFRGWSDVRAWITSVYFDDPDRQEAVERVLHPECYEQAEEDAEPEEGEWNADHAVLSEKLRAQLASGTGDASTIDAIETCGMWGAAMLEIGYADIELNITHDDGVPGSIYGEYFICLQQADGEWFSHTYTDTFATVDWMAPDWEEQLHRNMHDELLRYAAEQGWDLSVPFSLTFIPGDAPVQTRC